MRIRQVRKRIRCSRIIWNKGTKSTNEQALLSFPADADDLPEDLSMLTDEEKQELRDFWVAKKQADVDEKYAKQIRCGVPRILAITDALQHQSIDADEAARLWFATDKLLKELKKQGYGKPEKEPQDAPVFTLIDCE
ncbi:hypothetical protein [Wielerella bovis]|uniref:hypothetical protein n=1 Tax=Wielerella bovis TaxID=2917790 RepID=UPI00201967CF|nr:hypothetical protein [Wielerella bovis]ULJ67926.1 hypothetical protein MIS31_05135 [Wielerella bovis]